MVVTDRGSINVDQQNAHQKRAAVYFAIGDLVGQPMLAHKTVHEAHVAAEVWRVIKPYFDATGDSIGGFTPILKWVVGVTEDEAKAKGLAIEKGVFPWAASGRAVANGRAKVPLLANFGRAGEQRIIGGGIVGTHAGDMIG